jgi:Zn-dependent protease
MRIPIHVSPFFFLTSAIIGYLNSGNILGTIIWMGIIFISILFHEFGHALLSLAFGQRPRIEIVAFGGLTYPEGPKLSAWKEFIVIFAGPLFGFILFTAAYFLLKLPIQNTYLLYFLKATQFVNLFWTIVNLIPVLPLDGGQLVRVILEVFLGVKAWRYTHFISIAIASCFAIFFFVYGDYFIGAIFFLFAYQSFDGLNQVRNMTEEDNQMVNREELKDIEKLIKLNRLDEAKLELEGLKQKTSKGLLHTFATEYLAKIYFEQGNAKQAYQYLKTEKKSLTDEAKHLLLMSAFEVEDYQLVLELSPYCFRSLQSVDIAIRAAAAAAAIDNVTVAIEWLKTAKAYGVSDLSELIKDQIFDKIRTEEVFKKFLSSSL